MHTLSYSHSCLQEPCMLIKIIYTWWKSQIIPNMNTSCFLECSPNKMCFWPMPMWFSARSRNHLRSTHLFFKTFQDCILCCLPVVNQTPGKPLLRTFQNSPVRFHSLGCLPAHSRNWCNPVSIPGQATASREVSARCCACTNPRKPVVTQFDIAHTFATSN